MRPINNRINPPKKKRNFNRLQKTKNSFIFFETRILLIFLETSCVEIMKKIEMKQGTYLVPIESVPIKSHKKPKRTVVNQTLKWQNPVSH